MCELLCVTVLKNVATLTTVYIYFVNLLICVWALTQDYALPLSHILPLSQFKVALRNITPLDTSHSVVNIRVEIRTWHCSSCVLVLTLPFIVLLGLGTWRIQLLLPIL